MHIRRFFLWSLMLAVLAVGFDMASMSQYSRGVSAIARAVLLPESERVAAKAEARIYRERGTIVSIVGLVLALASLGFVIVSARKHEPAWRSLTVGFLTFYVLLQFALT